MKIKDVCWVKGRGKDSVGFNFDDGSRIAVLPRSKKGGVISSFYLNPEEGFWEAGEGFDIRNYGDLDIDAAVCHIKSNATFLLLNEDIGI